MNDTIQIKAVTQADPRWNDLKEYAASCSWRAGKALAAAMDHLKDWERVFAAETDGCLCGFCTAAKTDCLPDVPYTPYIGYVFVDEHVRGKRLSQRIICFAMDYLKSLGFDRVYLVSDHDNLYEKYGFQVIDRKSAPWGSEEKIYMRMLQKKKAAVFKRLFSFYSLTWAVPSSPYTIRLPEAFRLSR